MSGRYALIISNGEYEDQRLSGLSAPQVDAEALANVLRDPEIGAFGEVKILANVTAQDARIAIENFFAEKQRNDLLLLYFSGHGILDANNRLYLAARDTRFRPHSALLRKATAIEAALVRDEMNNTRARRTVLVLDCCHSGAFEEGSKGVTEMAVNTGAAFQSDDRSIGRVVLTASDATQFAWQGEELVGEQPGASVFTQAIVQGLESGEADLDHDGQISVHELYDYVQNRVKELSSESRPQNPRMWTFGQEGEFVLAQAVRREEVARQMYREVVRQIQDEAWDTAAARWNELRKRFPDFPDEYHVAERMAQWQQAQTRYAEMQRLVLARKGSQALDVWAAIKKEFPNFEDRRHLVREAEEAVRLAQERQWLNERYAQMQQLGAQQEWTRVLQIWQEILDVDPYFPDHRQLAQRAQEALSERQRQEEAQALRRRLDRIYAEMEQLVAHKQWKRAEERWQMIRGFDQSYQDVKHLVPLIRVGQKEERLQQQARERRTKLEAQYQEVLAHVQNKEWRAADELWRKIVAVDEAFPDRNNVLPAIRTGLGRRAQPAGDEAGAGKERRGCARPVLLVGLLSLGAVGLVGFSIALGLAWINSLDPTPYPTPAINDVTATSPSLPVIDEFDDVTQEPMPFDPAALATPPPATPFMVGCPFDANAFTMQVGISYGPFFTLDGVSYALGTDGVYFYTADGFGGSFYYELPQPNTWTPLLDSPFIVCVDSLGYYAWFNPDY